MTFTNHVFIPTRLKVCKVATGGVAVNTSFTFDLSADSGATASVSVPAGPAPGGYCEFAPENVFGIGDSVTLTERASDGVQTSAISVLPAGRQAAPPNLANGPVTILAGDGVNTVTFTNTTGVRQETPDGQTAG